MLQAQFTHILMTITAIYIMLSSLDDKKMLVGFGIITVGVIFVSHKMSDFDVAKCSVEIL